MESGLFFLIQKHCHALTLKVVNGDTDSAAVMQPEGNRCPDIEWIGIILEKFQTLRPRKRFPPDSGFIRLFDSSLDLIRNGRIFDGIIPECLVFGNSCV